MLVTLGEIVKDLGGLLYGDPAISIDKLAPIQLAQRTELAFLSNSKYSILLKESLAACIIVEPKLLETAMQRGACIVADDPYLYFARLTQWWQRLEDLNFVAGIHPSAVVHMDAAVHPTASIGPLCVVEQGVQIGANTILRSRVTVAYKCSIGERCVVHSGVVIGADGFGFAIDKARAGAWEKIAQLGNVRIGNDVEIGANTCIDRGALDDTCIEDGVKLDNLIQIGHNVKIGKHTAIAGCAGIAGSATIGAHCTIGGGAVVLGHLTIADNVHISASTTVTRSITAPGVYTGFFPVAENALWEKNAASLKQLHKLRERIRLIEKTIDLQVKKNQHDDGYS